ncbi:MAG: DUF169 domain-containing protein [Thermodesulfobacteriota bacterium]
MSTSHPDYSVFDRFNFKTKPVGVKFLLGKPDGIRRLDKVLDFCEMLKEAQEGDAFFATKEEFTCIGPLLLGMVDEDPVFESGRVGPRLEVFNDARANRRIYQYLPRLGKNVINTVAFSPLDRMAFDPDVLIISTEVSQAEIILRAKSFTTGEGWSAKGTPVAACSWLYIYPYLSGEMNLTVTGFGFGMKSRRLFPEGRVLLSIPWDLLPMITANLREMNWVPHSFTIGAEAHKKKIKKIVAELRQES